MRMPREDRSHHHPFGGPGRPVWTMRCVVSRRSPARSAERVVELPPDGLGLPVAAGRRGSGGALPTNRSSRSPAVAPTRLVLDEQAGADPLLRPAADAAGVEDRLGVLEARRDGRTAAPRRPDDEAAERPVVADEADRRLGRREGLSRCVRSSPVAAAESSAMPAGRPAAYGRIRGSIGSSPSPGASRMRYQVWTSNPIFS